jgi:hypothetical protein
MRYFWAFVFITLGVGIIGTAMGWWGNEIWASIWRFWPLVLVFIGLDLLTHDLALQPLIMIGALILAGAFVWDVAVSPRPILNMHRETTTNATSETSVSSNLSSNVKSAAVTVETGAIDFFINSGTDKFFDGKLNSNVARADVTSNITNDTASATISTPNAHDFWMGMTGFTNKLTLALTKNVPLDLTVKSGASKLNFDFSENQIKNLTVKAGASSIFTKLGNKTVGDASVNIDAGASSIEIEVPKSYSVTVRSESGLSSHDLSGFSKKDDVWVSDGNDANAKKINITIKSGVSSIKVTRY